jgi:hypothetical protein
VKSPQRQGMRGPRPLMVSCGGVAIPGRQRSTGKSAVSMWLTGRCGSRFGLWLAGPAEGCPGRTTMHSVLVAVVGWHGDGWWACCVGGAGRDLRMSGSGAVIGVGPSRGMRTDKGRKLESAELAQWENTAGPAGVGRADGRAVVRGCDEPLARGGGVVERVGAVWFGADRVCRRAFRDAQVCCWWAGGLGRLSHACHKWRETWRDAGRCTETISAGRWEGRDGPGRVNTA